LLDGWDAVVDLLDYPMFVVTTRSGDERAGCLVGFSTQASINPPRYLVGLSDKNHTFRVATGADRLAVHVLDRGDRHLAELFGTETGDEVDKFAQCRWQDGPGGVPVLDDAPAWFVGSVVSRHPLGDHVAFLVEPEVAHVREGDLTLLTFAQVRDLDPGHDA